MLFDSNTTTAGASYWLAPGCPTSADHPDAFLDAPRLVSPPGSFTPLVGASLAWDPAGEAATQLVAQCPGYAWYVRSASAAATAITVPALPTSVDASDLFGGSCVAQLVAEGPFLDGVDFYSQLGISHGVMLDP